MARDYSRKLWVLRVTPWARLIESEPPLVNNDVETNKSERDPHQVGYRGATACAAAGITYRQLDYWARTGLVEPSIRTAHGSGTARLYGFRDILVLKIVKRLLDEGVFGIAVGKVWHEVEGSLSTLQGELFADDSGQSMGVEGNDELSLRRKAKGA
jgi:hypothetical protein